MDDWSEDWLKELKNNMIEKLHFAPFEICNLDIPQLSPALSTNTSLQELCIVRNEIDDRDVEKLSRALSNNKTLLNFELCFNQIGDKGAEYLAQALLKNKALKSLDLYDNNIGNLGAKHLAQALLKNTSLQHLDVRENYNIGLQGQSYIRNALQKNPSLKEFLGFRLVKDCNCNETTLENWRLEIQEKRRKKIKRILSNFIEELNLIDSIFKMESLNFFFKRQPKKTKKIKKTKHVQQWKTIILDFFENLSIN